MSKSLPQKALWLLLHRPAHLLGTMRTYFFFSLSYYLRKIGLQRLKGVELSENVRLQKNSSVMAEQPSAKIAIGENSIVYEDSRVEAYGEGRVEVGNDSIIGGAQIVSRHSVIIGARCLSSWNVFIQDFDAHPIDASSRRLQVEKMVADFRPVFSKKEAQAQSESLWDFPGEAVSIGDDVWIGSNVTILKGATIGAGCVIGAGSVVLKGQYPANSLLAGNPAKVVKTLQKEAA